MAASRFQARERACVDMCRCAGGVCTAGASGLWLSSAHQAASGPVFIFCTSSCRQGPCSRASAILGRVCEPPPGAPCLAGAVCTHVVSLSSIRRQARACVSCGCLCCCTCLLACLLFAPFAVATAFPTAAATAMGVVALAFPRRGVVAVQSQHHILSD